jgi:ATP-dependent Clp protease ATP-binding subunit ClpC
MVDPPTYDETIQILKTLNSNMKNIIRVKYSDDAIESAVSLSNRYITDRHLPDKAIDVIDEAGSRVHMGNFEVPQEVLELEGILKKSGMKKLLLLNAGL